ncbi:MAG: LuxR C-terminal-related transcriptional regulator, partial [Arthrobacter sp.]
GLSGIDCEAGDVDAANTHLTAAADFFDNAPMTETRFRWFVARALAADAEGRPDDAVELLREAERLYRRGFFPEVRPIAAMTARIRIAQGRLPEAAAWAQQRGVSVTDDAGYLAEFDHLTLVRILIARHRKQPDGGTAGEAARLLERLLESAEAGGRAGSLLEIRMLQALVQDARGNRGQARATLGQAFAEAPEPGGYARLFLAEGAPMIGLLEDAAHHGTAGDHPRRLLSLAAPPETAAPAPEPSPSSVETLSVREMQVLRLLDSELSGPEIARQLFISHNTLRTHTKHIFTKLGVATRLAAVRRARERGLL